MNQRSVDAHAQLITMATACLATAYLALWACAPMATMPALMPQDQARPNQFNVAGAIARPAGISNEFYSDNGRFKASGQATYLHQFKWLDVGGQVAAGNTGAAIGALGRVRVINRQDLQLGFQVSGGLLYSVIGMPVSALISEGIWLYTNPNYGLALPEVQLPAGIAVTLDGFDVFVEGGVGLNSQENGGGTLLQGGKLGKVLPYAATGASVRW